MPISERVIKFPAKRTVASAGRTVNRKPAQVAQMMTPIACNYVPMVPAVEENIVSMWLRGVTIRNIAAMYGGRGYGVAQIEAIVWVWLRSDDRRAA